MFHALLMLPNIKINKSIFAAIDAKDELFFDTLFKHQNLNLSMCFNQNAKSPLQYAILQGKLQRALKILEKISEPDTTALKLAQDFSYNELVTAYQNKFNQKNKNFVSSRNYYTPNSKGKCIIV
jgi:hypothetical protein